jgi:hypothetical protein
MVYRRIGSILLAAALVGCASDAPDPSGPTGHEWVVGVTVTLWAGSPPIYLYTWTMVPDGEAHRVTVSRVSDEGDVVVWEIVSDSGRGIRSGVVHGIVPDGATATVEVETTLTPGAGGRYRVSVTLTDERMGWTEFHT